jgi:hypothetical protein
METVAFDAGAPLKVTSTSIVARSPTAKEAAAGFAPMTSPAGVSVGVAVGVFVGSGVAVGREVAVGAGAVAVLVDVGKGATVSVGDGDGVSVGVLLGVALGFGVAVGCSLNALLYRLASDTRWERCVLNLWSRAVRTDLGATPPYW